MDNNNANGGAPNENIPKTQSTGAIPLKRSATYRSPPVIPPTLPSPTREADIAQAMPSATQKQVPTSAHLESSSGETLRKRSGPYTKTVLYPGRSQQRRLARQHSWTVLTASSTSTHQPNSTRDPSEELSGSQAGGLGWLSGGLLVAQTLLHRGNAQRERSSAERLKDFVPYQWLLQRLTKAAATGQVQKNETSDPSSGCEGKSAKHEQQRSHQASSSTGGKCAYQPYSRFAEPAMCKTLTDSDSRPFETKPSQTEDEPMELGSEHSSEMETETAHNDGNRPDGVFMENAAFDRLLFGHNSKPLGGVSDNRLRCPDVGMETESSIVAEEGCEDTIENGHEEGKTRERRRRFLSGPSRLVDTSTDFAEVMAATTKRMRGKKLMEDDVLKRNQPRDQLPKVPAKRRWKSF